MSSKSNIHSADHSPDGFFTGGKFRYWQNYFNCSFCLQSLIALAVFFAILSTATHAQAETRKLKLYFLHTGEKATIAYKRNGKFLPAGLKRVNVFLRDWRRNEPTRMDPFLLDLIWEVYKKSGSKDYIHVISAYRAPATNNMLRKRGRGVAKKSQHTLGKALDFFLPDVKLSKLRKIGLIKQAGGVGYYPSSGSPFVHMDTGRVRHWPRMTRKQLVAVFPNGKTLHVPTDGKPLAGYNQAVAAYNARKSSTKKIELAKGTEKERKSFFARLASLRGNEDDEDGVANNTPAPRKVRTSTSANNLAPKPAAPVDRPENPGTPDNLPLIASIPIPRSAPRDQLNTTSTTILADASNASANQPIATIDDSQPLDSPLFNIPVPDARPDIAPVLVARTDIEPPALPVNPANNTPSTRHNINALDSNANNQLRAQLIAQAKDQLRAQLFAPPRPDVNVGSGFQTALLTPQDHRANNTASSLTRSLSTIPATPGNGNLSGSNHAANENNPIDDEEVISGNIPAPVPNPLAHIRQNTPPSPIDEQLNNSGNIVAPVQNPQLVAALEKAALDNNPTARIIPLKRPSLTDNDPSSAERANSVLALVDDNNDTIATRENLATMMAKQAEELAAETGRPNDISAIILAAIPTPSPLRAFEQEAQTPRINDQINTHNDQIALLTSSPRPLDDLSLNWFEQNRTGQFILASSMTINASDKMRAPAYGRAAIRQTPQTVLTAGFKPEGAIQNSLKFSGSALSYQPFTSFN